MSKLDKKRTELELIQVNSARAALEFRIEELLEEIDRIKTHIDIQSKKEIELKEKIKNL
jgi:hypothetical protein